MAAEPIRIAYSSVNPHALLAWIAENRGLYAKYGLASVLVYVPGGSVPIQALASGDIDLAQMGCQFVTRQDVEKPADLKGKRLGISRFGSSSDFSTKVLLSKK